MHTVILHSDFAERCLLCGTPLAGPYSLVLRLFGISRSSHNPNLCSRCYTHAEERVIEITVLFADLSSFTELAQELGAERAYQVADAFLRMATKILVKYDAYIDKYAGDGVMALFNVPIRRQDHAARAVQAALELEPQMRDLRKRFNLDLKAGIGVASGWARVGRLDAERGNGYTAIGDAVNLAARLEGQAGGGEILIDKNVYNSIAADLENVQAESLVLKGFREPVTAYRLIEGTQIRLQESETKKEQLSTSGWGSMIFALLGAPCAGAVFIGPLAVALGIGGLFGATSAIWIFDEAPIRLPILILGTLWSIANLYTVWYARQLRQRTLSKNSWTNPIERRRTWLVVSSSILTLAIVAFEIFSHGNIMHHPFP